MKLRNLDIHLKYWLALLGVLALITGVFQLKAHILALDEFQSSYEQLQLDNSILKAEIDSLKV